MKKVEMVNITLYDVYILQSFLEEIPRKTIVELVKQHKISRTRYPEEVKIAIKIFADFFKLMLQDVIKNKVQFKYSRNKTIKLNKVVHEPTLKKVCKKNQLIPSMPVYTVILQDRLRGHYLKKNLIIYNELGEELMGGNRMGTLTLGILKNKTTNDYLEDIQKLYQGLPIKYIRKIINHGLKYLFLPISKRHVCYMVSEYTPTMRKIQFMTADDIYSKFYAKHQMVKFTGNHKRDTYYAVLTDEQKKELDAGQKEINTFCMFSIKFVKLFWKKTFMKYKHVYQIADTSQFTYKFTIIKQNVETRRLKYVYRRINNRLKPVNISE